MDRLHKIQFSERKATLTGTHGLRGDLRGNRQPQDRQFMARYMCDAEKSKAKLQWAIEKPKLDNARHIRGIFFIEPNDEEFKHIMKNVGRKLETPMPAAMTCETAVNCRGETCRSIGKLKTKNACIVDAGESMRIRLEGVPHRYHEDHIAAKGINSLSHDNLLHMFIPMLQASKNSRCKGTRGKTMVKLERIPARQQAEVRNKKRGDRRSKE